MRFMYSHHSSMLFIATLLTSILSLPQLPVGPTAGTGAIAGRAPGTLGPDDPGSVGTVGTAGTAGYIPGVSAPQPPPEQATPPPDPYLDQWIKNNPGKPIPGQPSANLPPSPPPSSDNQTPPPSTENDDDESPQDQNNNNENETIRPTPTETATRQPEESQDGGEGMTIPVAAIVGVIVGIVVLLFIIFLILKRTRDKHNNDMKRLESSSGSDGRAGASHPQQQQANMSENDGVYNNYSRQANVGGSSEQLMSGSNDDLISRAIADPEYPTKNVTPFERATAMAAGGGVAAAGLGFGAMATGQSSHGNNEYEMDRNVSPIIVEGNEVHPDDVPLGNSVRSTALSSEDGHYSGNKFAAMKMSPTDTSVKSTEPLTRMQSSDVAYPPPPSSNPFEIQSPMADQGNNLRNASFITEDDQVIDLDAIPKPLDEVRKNSLVIDSQDADGVLAGMALADNSHLAPPSPLNRSANVLPDSFSDERKDVMLGSGSGDNSAVLSEKSPVLTRKSSHQSIEMLVDQGNHTDIHSPKRQRLLSNDDLNAIKSEAVLPDPRLTPPLTPETLRRDQEYLKQLAQMQAEADARSRISL